jgi:hypothetical protein
MMAPTVEPASFWPLTDTLGKQIALSTTLYGGRGWRSSILTAPGT